MFVDMLYIWSTEAIVEDSYLLGHDLGTLLRYSLMCL